MRICDLRQKEVINIKDCKRLGYVCDIEFDRKTGCITQLIVPGTGKQSIQEKYVGYSDEIRNIAFHFAEYVRLDQISY